jgi:hypothetical protein
VRLPLARGEPRWCLGRLLFGALGLGGLEGVEVGLVLGLLRLPGVVAVLEADLHLEEVRGENLPALVATLVGALDLHELLLGDVVPGERPLDEDPVLLAKLGFRDPATRLALLGDGLADLVLLLVGQVGHSGQGLFHVRHLKPPCFYLALKSRRASRRSKRSRGPRSLAGAPSRRNHRLKPRPFGAGERRRGLGARDRAGRHQPSSRAQPS